MRWLLIALIVITSTIANMLKTIGMKRSCEVCDFLNDNHFRRDLFHSMLQGKTGGQAATEAAS
jgi:hypothetical protein